MEKIILNIYKVKKIPSSLALTLHSFGFSLKQEDEVFLFDNSLSNFSSLDLSSTSSRRIFLFFSNISDKSILEESSFSSSVKEKEVFLFFKNCSSFFFLRCLKGTVLSFKNRVFLNNSSVSFSNLFFDVTTLFFHQENNLNNFSKIFQNDVSFLSFTQRNTLSIVNNHLSKSTRSTTTLKNVLKDSSFSKYDGMINIVKKGDFSKAYLETNTMLLSQESSCITVPMLEIIPKNIKATHAATVEHVTEDQLFYLSSRGLSRSQAYSLMISSFLKGNLSLLPEVLKDFIDTKIGEKL